MRRLVLVLAILVASAAGCTATADVQWKSASCDDIPSSFCNDEIQSAANAAGAPVEDVDIVCTAWPCTRARGTGTTTVTRPDGSTVMRPWTYVGDPGPQPVPQCIAVPDDICRAQVRDNIGDVPIHQHVTGIRVACTSGPCDATSGDARIDYTFGDGSTQTVTTEWEP